jgi:hypothetical protein
MFGTATLTIGTSSRSITAYEHEGEHEPAVRVEWRSVGVHFD